ncbi:hypothetical protein AX16_002733 [Volvariella volvacea WC 439]|nr:hypothetical protein AX16_002733 [Volvariella volvacea WC 439]
MSITNSPRRHPQDIVAIFHASFHPTQGNVVDWSMKASDDLSLDNVEFSALPSGLHLVDQDVVYFTKDGFPGVCIFRRRRTVEHGHRGYRLSSLGILLARSKRPRPWRHTADLKHLITTIYSKVETSGQLQPSGSDWNPAVAFFEERKVVSADLGGAGDWHGWNYELTEIETQTPDINPTLHLSHLLRILGPSTLTLYKHVLGRRRILIYTLPPVEAACMLCQVAADICYEDQVDEGVSQADTSGRGTIGKLRGRSREPINVLGMVTLNDLDRLRTEGMTGRGWVACTTDAIFLEKPSYYDLLIDLTTITANRSSRPTFYASKPISPQPSSSKETHRLSIIRFAWSDVRLWNELDRILHLDVENGDGCCGAAGHNPELPPKPSKSISAWTDAWRVYEDVCLVCAGLWLGAWRGNSTMSYSTANGPENWGAVRLEGDDDFSINATGYVRQVGMGIENVPQPSGSGGSIGSGPSSPSLKGSRKSRGTSWTVNGRPSLSIGKGKQLTSPSMDFETIDPELDARERRDGQRRTVLALLQTFHAHTLFQLSVLESFLPKGISSRDGGSGGPLVHFSSREMVAFELGPLSGSDARYLEWLVQEYGGGRQVVVKRGWKDLLGVIFGYG